MEDKQQKIRQLFVKLAEGTSTPGERQELLQHLEGNPLPEDLPLADELRPKTGWPEMPDHDADRIRMQILSEVQPVHTARVRRMGWWKAAAVVLPLAGLAAWLFWSRPSGSEVVEYVNDSHSVKTFRLDDGSEISLNRAARLTVRKSAPREAWLEGEAFFTITANPSRPFVVHTRHQLDVTVLGTTFNVKSGEHATEVVLNTGKVKVGNGGNAVILQPGEMAVYEADNKRMLRRDADTLLHTSWKNDLVPFREQPLKAVMQHLGKQFGYGVEFEGPALDSLMFTGYLSANDLRQSVHTLEETFSVKISIVNNKLHVSKQ